jgi:hypothetical protein
MTQEQPPGPRRPVGATNQISGPVSALALFTALAVLAAFTAFVWYMITQRNVAEITWTRLAWLFSSVAAIGFGAAGALFGSNIQRQRAENAESAAERNADAAANGRALAAAIKADDPGTPTLRAGLERLGPAQQTSTAAEELAARHAAIARELFP